MKTEDDPQLGILEVRGSQGVNAAPGFHAGERRERLEQIAEVVEGGFGHPLETQPIALLGIDHEAVVTLDIVF